VRFFGLTSIALSGVSLLSTIFLEGPSPSRIARTPLQLLGVPDRRLLCRTAAFVWLFLLPSFSALPHSGPFHRFLEQPLCNHGAQEYIRDNRSACEPAAVPQAGGGAGAGVRWVQDAARVRAHQDQHGLEPVRGAVSHQQRGGA